MQHLFSIKSNQIVILMFSLLSNKAGLWDISRISCDSVCLNTIQAY